MQKFGGDDIDRMLEAGSYQNYHKDNGSYKAVPPPTGHYQSGRGHQPRHRGPPPGHRPPNNRGGPPNRDRSRSRGRGGGPGGGNPNHARGAFRNEEDYYGYRRRSSLSPPPRYLTREEEERRRKDREQQDIERDQRTVFACQIHPKCDERDIFGFFSDVGRVCDVQLIRDNRTFKSKGLCYVEFEDKSSVAQALSLSGQSLGGFPVSVQLTQAEKNRAAQQAAQIAQQSRPMKLYVSNIHMKVTEEDIRPVFSAFGEILSLEIKKDHRHKSKGYGFVEFKKEIDAIGAMQQLNDLEILGQKIKVTAADQPSVGIMGASAANGAKMNSGGHGMDGGGGHSQTTKISEDEGNGGLALSTADKLALMQKLGRGTVKPQANHPNINMDQQSKHHGHGGPGLPAHIQTPTQYSSFNNNIRSRCVLLSNMFNPKTESDPDFDMEIREDVREEVGKFGSVLHIYVDKTAKEGLVYLKFEDMNQATKTINNLNGRWFAKNQIKANYCDEQTYNHQFQL